MPLCIGPTRPSPTTQDASRPPQQQAVKAYLHPGAESEAVRVQGDPRKGHHGLPLLRSVPLSPVPLGNALIRPARLLIRAAEVGGFTLLRSMNASTSESWTRSGILTPVVLHERRCRTGLRADPEPLRGLSDAQPAVLQPGGTLAGHVLDIATCRARPQARPRAAARRATEVPQQDAMAGAGHLGDVAQRPTADTTAGEQVEHGRLSATIRRRCGVSGASGDRRPPSSPRRTSATTAKHCGR